MTLLEERKDSARLVFIWLAPPSFVAHRFHVAALAGLETLKFKWIQPRPSIIHLALGSHVHLQRLGVRVG